MENINSLSGYLDYSSYIEDIAKLNASVGANVATAKATNDILDTLLEGTFQMDSEIPEGSTFSLHV